MAVGRASHHYRLLEFYVPTTRGYRISGTFRLNPTHWKLPAISEQDKTVVAVTELLEQHKKFTPPLAIHKMKRFDIIKKLKEILSDSPPSVLVLSLPFVVDCRIGFLIIV